MGIPWRLRKVGSLLGGVAGVAVPVVAFGALALSLLRAPWFSWTQHALSDLGIDPVTAALFNGGMAATGLLMLCLAFGLMGTGRLRHLGRMLVVPSVLLVGIGLVPETSFLLHWTISAGFFLSIPLFYIIYVIIKYDINNKAIPLCLAGISLGAVSLLVVFEGVAIPEALVAFPFFVWVSTLAHRFLVLPRLAQRKTLRNSTPAING